MSKSLKYIIVITLLIFNKSYAQTVQIPEVGKPMPDFFLSKVTHYKSSTASLSDFKGKWLFLDFWFQGCVPCIQSFPLINAHYKKFKDRLDWVLVGLNDQKYNKNTQSFYEKLRAKQGLEMPAAYDSLLNKKWGIHSMPHIIIVNPQGIVHSITSGRDITSDKIERLLKGELVKFYPKDIEMSKFSADDLVSTADTTKNRIFYRSLLCAWNGEEQKSGMEMDIWVTWPENLLKKGYNMSMVPLYAMYNYAYWGRWSWDFHDEKLYGLVYPNPIIEMEDKSLFNYDYNFNVGKGTYNYSLTIPVSDITEANIKRYLQEDLHRAFKYSVIIENRKMPVWKLVAKDGAIEKLKTTGGERYATPGSHAAGYTLTNWPTSYLIGSLSFFVSEKIREPFVDETGLCGNIDFTIEADMTNIEDIKKELRKQGLDLVKGMKEMKVLVIRDSKGK